MAYRPCAQSGGGQRRTQRCAATAQWETNRLSRESEGFLVGSGVLAANRNLSIRGAARVLRLSTVRCANCERSYARTRLPQAPLFMLHEKIQASHLHAAPHPIAPDQQRDFPQAPVLATETMPHSHRGKTRSPPDR